MLCLSSVKKRNGKKNEGIGETTVQRGGFNLILSSFCRGVGAFLFKKEVFLFYNLLHCTD
jgi:hypothetical protein